MIPRHRRGAYDGLQFQNLGKEVLGVGSAGHTWHPSDALRVLLHLASRLAALASCAERLARRWAMYSADGLDVQKWCYCDGVLGPMSITRSDLRF